MKRMTLLFLLIFLVFSPASGMAAGHFIMPREEINNTFVGTIKAVGRNRIDIYDEYAQTLRSFTYMDRASPYHPGDRVRIYYDLGDSRITLIKKMTPLKYAKDGQNLGQIMRK